MRSRSDCEEKPPKTTLWIAPMRVQARIAIASSGIICRYIVTTSPLFTPFLRSTLAKRLTSVESCW